VRPGDLLIVWTSPGVEKREILYPTTSVTGHSPKTHDPSIQGGEPENRTTGVRQFQGVNCAGRAADAPTSR
jgi:hypothetical protein